eukprot:4223100-Prymnesium_polylepis.1
MAEKPEQNATMFKNLQEMVNASGKKGELPGCGPDANGNYEAPGHLWYAGDEMGVEPNGKKWTRVLTRRDTGSDKVHRIVTGEHSPFWVTLLFFSRLDGTIPIPPCVIHKAKTMRGDLAHGLPVMPGKAWLVRASES